MEILQEEKKKRKKEQKLLDFLPDILKKLPDFLNQLLSERTTHKVIPILLFSDTYKTIVHKRYTVVESGCSVL